MLRCPAWSQADVDTHIQWFKKQIGGAWMRVYQDATTGKWKVDLTADNKRYDSTDDTITTITGFDSRITKTWVTP